ncbi:hypothetical protein HC928_07060 [bacterium]|nr:hypothetical protein [bacterium]
MQVSWFDWLVGDTRKPQSLILFAPQGHGKTSHRIEVARLARTSAIAPALVVTLNDVSMLLQSSGEPIDLPEYISILRRLVVIQLWQYVSAHPARLNELRAHRDAEGRLLALLHLYAPLYAIDVPGSNINPYIQIFQQRLFGPVEWLKILSELASKAGCASIYVLIDGLDESDRTRNDPKLMGRILAPLLDAPNILQECGFAFKFFLPATLKNHLLEHNIGRLDRIPYRSLEWEEAQLLQMFSQRLSSYSRMSETVPLGRVNSFQMLCENEIPYDVDRRLVQAADLSPRTLLDLARQIIEQHCTQTNRASDLIQAHTIDKVLFDGGKYSDVTVFEVAGTADSNEDEPFEPDNTSALPLLFFNSQTGEVWIGEQKKASKWSSA